MIKSFADRRTARLFSGTVTKGVSPTLARRVQRRLLEVDAATNLAALAGTPGNRLEALVGDRKGQWSVRVNDQWRICFRWDDGDAYDVELTDYH